MNMIAGYGSFHYDIWLILRTFAHIIVCAYVFMVTLGPHVEACN